MTMEEWRTISSFPKYQASSLGRIRRIAPYNSTTAGRVLTETVRESGYRVVTCGSAPRYVHRLVCEAFHGGAPTGQQVAHLDGKPANNQPANLKWATRKENEAHKEAHGTKAQGERCGASRLGTPTISLIKSHLMFGERQTVLASLFGISQSHVSRIARHETWKHLEF